MISVAKRNEELLGELLADERFQEWVWGRLELDAPMVPVEPSTNPSRDAWLAGRKSAGVELIATILNNYPLRYLAMVQSAAAWKAQREARDQ